MNTRLNPCVFCKNLSNGASDAPWDKVLQETDNFFITPSKGSLVPGWLLVVSKKHAICSGAIDGTEFQDLTGCLRLAVEMVHKRFGSVTVFEHGPSVPGTSLGCGIDHQHLHVVPLAFSLKDAVSALFPSVEWALLSDLSGTRALYRSRIDYGLVQETNGRIWWCRPPNGVRQVFRRVIAHNLGIPDQFDYAGHPHLSNTLQTLAYLSPSHS